MGGRSSSYQHHSGPKPSFPAIALPAPVATAAQAAQSWRFELTPRRDLVLIPFPKLGTLAMTREQFDSELAAGRAMSSTPPNVDPQNPPDMLVDAAGMEKRTGVPASWWMTQARERWRPVPEDLTSSALRSGCRAGELRTVTYS
jgi:hypothetical protein